MSVLVSILIWRLPVKIVKYFLNLEPAEATQQRTRRRPLHTCGASLVATTQRACTKLQSLDGALGSTATRTVSFINMILPFVYSLFYPLFSLLLLIDDYILVFESKAESIFPPSTVLFDVFDGLVCSTEKLPEHVDRVVTKLSSIIRRFSFLKRALLYMMSWVNCIVSVLTRLVKRNTRGKETQVDDAPRFRFLKNQTKVLEEPPFVDSPMYSSYKSANSSPVSDCSESEGSLFNRKSEMSYSYKEMLEKGHREETAWKSSNEGRAIGSKF